MRKLIITICAAVALFTSCKKSSNNNLSVPKTGTEYIIDTSVVARANILIYTENGPLAKQDTIFYPFALPDTVGMMGTNFVALNWVYLGGTKYKTTLAGTNYQILSEVGGIGNTLTTGAYLEIVNSDTVNNFGH